MIKWLLVGRTAAGKDFLAEQLKQRGMRQVKSYATRPKRTPDEDTHLFISKEEAQNTTDKVAKTVIGEYEYFATRQQVIDSDIYVIDPIGVKELTANMPDVSFWIIYLEGNKEKRLCAAMQRAEDPNEAKLIFHKRSKDEDEQFLEFEEKVHEYMATNDNPRREMVIAPNIIHVTHYINNYDKEEMKQFAEWIFMRTDLHEKMKGVVVWGIKNSALETKNGDVVVRQTLNEPPQILTPDQMADKLLSSENAGKFQELMRQYMISDYWKAH